MINDRKEAILFIANKQHGSKKELIGGIGEKFFNQFCRMGFIKKGITKDKLEQVNSTWQITKLGKEQEKFYREPTRLKRLDGQRFYALGV